jgi:pyrimidine-specific ribonucleoside hydrolase
MKTSILKKKIYLLLLALTISGLALAHSGKPKYHVIIDTDGAIDDMRAISMFLAANDIRVLAITASQGTLLPETVYDKVNSLLSTFHHEGILTGIGEKTDQTLPFWSSFAESVIWGVSDGKMNNAPLISTNEFLNKISHNYPRKITLVALGSLKTFADWLKANPENKTKVERIIWYNDLNIINGFNYKASPESFDVIKQMDLPLEIVSLSGKKIPCNKEYILKLKITESPYSNHITDVLNQDIVQKMINENHLLLFDDLIPLYLTLPVLFNTEDRNGIKYISPNPLIPDQLIFENIAQLLASSNSTNNRMFINFPLDSSLYIKEVAAIMHKTLKKFGNLEWKAVCLTNEIHGHTGIYSIIGAKAGIRAIEYFNVGVNNLNVISFAGNTPPLSCFNDGLQISTGATIGQGLIKISDSLYQTPTVIFEFNNQKIKMTLKQNIADQMKKDISFGIKNYGLESDKYWLFIEELALKYWSDLDRYQIFSITPL